MEFIFNNENCLVLLGVFFLSIITTVSGIGGGSIFIPYLILTKDFDLLTCIPLAITIILADCLIRMLLLFKMINPNKPERYLMDLTIGNIIVPFDGLFSWVGIYLLLYLPNILTVVMIIFLTILSMIKIGVTMLKECKSNKENKVYPELDGIEMYHMEMKTQPVEVIEDRYFNLFLIIISVLLVGLFGFREKFDNTSLEYWLMIGGNIIVLGIMCLLSGLYLTKQYKKRKENRFVFVSSDIVWNKNNILSLGCLSSIAGILSTWLGLGGSSLITPILYYFEMKPEVISVSIGVSTLFSSLISLLNFISSGNYLYSWGILLFITSLLGSFIGIHLLKCILRYFRKGVISLLVIIVMIISVLSLITSKVIN